MVDAPAHLSVCSLGSDCPINYHARWGTHISLVNCGLAGFDGPAEAARCGPDSCRPEAGKHHAGRPDPISFPGQGHRFRFSKFHVAGCLLDIPSVEILQVGERYYRFI